jgi:hypothetical protein
MKSVINYDNVLDTISTLLKEFNDSIGRQHCMFEMLVAKHRGVNSELYHIDISGKTDKIKYKGYRNRQTYCRHIL